MLGCFLLSGTFRLFITSLLSDPLCKRTCGYGGIGRRARFRFWWDPPCRFKSCYPHYFDNHHRQQTRGSACCFFLFSAHIPHSNPKQAAQSRQRFSSSFNLHPLSQYRFFVDALHFFIGSCRLVQRIIHRFKSVFVFAQLFRVYFAPDPQLFRRRTVLRSQGSSPHCPSPDVL